MVKEKIGRRCQREEKKTQMKKKGAGTKIRIWKDVEDKTTPKWIRIAMRIKTCIKRMLELSSVSSSSLFILESIIFFMALRMKPCWATLLLQINKDSVLAWFLYLFFLFLSKPISTISFFFQFGIIRLSLSSNASFLWELVYEN